MQTIDFDEYQARLAERKRELGIVIDPERYRNDGSRRTASKRALLQALADLAASEDSPAPYRANF